MQEHEIRTMHEVARAHSRRGEHAQAKALYEELVARVPSDATFVHERGLCSFKMHDLGGARRDYDRSIELDDRQPRFFQDRGVLFEDLREWNLALADFDRCLALGTTDFIAETYNSRGCAHYGNGDAERALADWDRSTELDPRLWKPYHNRGLLYAAQGDDGAALAEIERGLSHGPYALLFADRGAVRTRAGDLRGAVDDYQRALALTPDDAGLLCESARLLLDLDEPQASMRALDRAAQLVPSSVDICCNRGVAYARLGEPERALEEFTRGLKLSPSDLECLQNRGAAHHELGHAAEAFADLDAARRLAPDDLDVLFNWGIAAETLGRTEDAKEAYERVAAESPAEEAERIASARERYERMVSGA
jgi:tetratricopeptide (TPR) repeat protein